MCYNPHFMSLGVETGLCKSWKLFEFKPILTFREYNGKS